MDRHDHLDRALLLFVCLLLFYLPFILKDMCNCGLTQTCSVSHDLMFYRFAMAEELGPTPTNPAEKASGASPTNHVPLTTKGQVIMSRDQTVSLEETLPPEAPSQVRFTIERSRRMIENRGLREELDMVLDKAVKQLDNYAVIISKPTLPKRESSVEVDSTHLELAISADLDDEDLFEDLMEESSAYVFAASKDTSKLKIVVKKENNTTALVNRNITFGYLQGGDGMYLLCHERAWDEDSNNLVNMSVVKQGCDRGYGCCGVEEPQVIWVEDLDYPNLFMSSPKGSNFTIINYLTSYRLFSYQGCSMRIEAGGCLMKTSVDNNWNPFYMYYNEKILPVAHILVPRTKENINCRIRMCAIMHGRESKNGIHTSKFRTVEVKIFKGQEVRTRKLLSVDPRISSYKWQHSCNTRTMMFPYQKSLVHTVGRSIAGDKMTFCNGTRHTSLELGGPYNCYTVGHQQTLFQCPGLKRHRKGEKVDVNCTVDLHPHKCNHGICIKIKMEGSGFVKLSGTSWSAIKKCDKECNAYFGQGDNMVVQCPDGKLHHVHANRIDFDCPFVDYTKGASLYVCRATSRPKLLYALIFWAFGGVPLMITVLTVLRFICYLASLVCIYLKSVRDRSRKHCEGCGCFVNSCYEWQRHELCKNGSCPFCKNRYSVSGLLEHAPKCLDRKRVESSDLEVVNLERLPRPLRQLGTLCSKARGRTVKALWVLIMIISFMMVISPASSTMIEFKQNGLWTEELEEVEICRSECEFLEDKCRCLAKHEQLSRTLLALMPKETSTYTVDVQAPWGTVHIGDTIKPRYSPKAITMSWTTVDSLPDSEHIELSGRSETYIPLLEKTGITWTLSDHSAAEKRTLVINILDFTQVYETRFLYLTGDRTVGDWMHGTCTGDCPDKCGCDTSSCTYARWRYSRNWHCNPGWCWAMDSGCTCCALDINKFYTDWLVSKWAVTYKGTEVLACVEYNSDYRSCDVFHAGMTISHGPFKVQFSEPKNIGKKLPETILLVHGAKGASDGLDLHMIREVTSGVQACRLQSCTHGSVGDMQILNLNDMIGNDVYFEHYFTNEQKKRGAPKADGEDDRVWMSWDGVVQRYHCVATKWPDCEASGIVTRNHASFQNLIKTSFNYSAEYFFHALHVSLNQSVPTLELEARPHEMAGGLDIFLEVDKLRLKKKEASLTDLQLLVESCEGCYGCVSGIDCTVSIVMSGISEIYFHLKSKTEHFVISSSSIPVTDQEKKRATVKGFTPIPLKQVCLEIEESGLCKKCSPTVSCIPVSLSEPKAVALEHRSMLHVQLKDNCTSVISCIGGGLQGFLSNLSALFGSFFGPWFTGIFMTALFFIVAVLTVLYGPTAFRLAKVVCCSKSRKLKSARGILKLYQKAEKERLLSGKGQAVDSDDLATYFKKDK
uniref:M polyprotein n=1 Tax=Estero Real virus TaxID=2170057 RepID=A0A7D9MVN8_9VIRU|nr:polyprotein [Estero Real virus]